MPEPHVLRDGGCIRDLLWQIPGSATLAIERLTCAGLSGETFRDVLWIAAIEPPGHKIVVVLPSDRIQVRVYPTTPFSLRHEVALVIARVIAGTADRLDLPRDT